MKKLMILTFAALLIGGMVLSAAAEDFTYTPLKKCKMCHMPKKIGSQYKVWAAGPHAGAFETLKNEQSAAIAKDMGIEDPTTDPFCLKCHTTGYGEGGLPEGILAESGVGCQSCHGPGSAYFPKKVMNGLADGSIEPASVGLAVIEEATCTVCHNEESPTFKGFDYAERVKEVAHPVPVAE